MVDTGRSGDDRAQLARRVGADLDAILPPPAHPSPGRSPHVRILAAGRRAAGPHWRGLGSFAAALLVGLSIGSLTARDPPPAPPPSPSPAPAPQPLTITVAPAAPAPAPVVPVRTAAVEAAPRRAEQRPKSVREPRGYGAVLAADRRLRNAYDRAARAGVDRPTLVSYRARWASLRRRASDEPPRLIRGYGDLASDLEMLARDARAARRRA